MTQKEFKELAGFEVENFMKVHDLYLETTLTKQDFCRDYKHHRTSLIIIDLYDRIKTLTSSYKSLTATNRNLHDEREALGMKLLHTSIKYSDDELYNDAIDILGIETCVRFKLQENLPLLERDRDFLIQKME